MDHVTGDTMTKDMAACPLAGEIERITQHLCEIRNGIESMLANLEL